MKKFSIIFLISSLLLSVFSSFSAKDLKITLAGENGKKVFTFSRDNTVFVFVTDSTQNKDAQKKDFVKVIITSETEMKGEGFLIQETDLNSGVFMAKIIVKESQTAIPNDNILQVSQGDKLSAKYTIPKEANSFDKVLEDEAYFVGPMWTFENTGENHTILIPQDAVITIDGKPISKGDFISVFYEVKNGNQTELINAGGTGREISVGGVRWMGKTCATAAWGTQKEKKNGFAAGEDFKWKIWRASDGKEFVAVATYLEDKNLPDKGKYVKDGISGIKSLTASSTK